MAPPLVLLPGKSHGRRSPVGCSPWGHEESDTTERLPFPLSLSLSQDGAPSLPLLSLFYLLCFFLPPFEDNGLLFWVPDVLCWHSEIVLWDLLSVQIFFDVFVGERVVSPSYSSCIFHYIFKINFYWSIFALHGCVSFYCIAK